MTSEPQDARDAPRPRPVAAARPRAASDPATGPSAASAPAARPSDAGPSDASPSAASGPAARPSAASAPAGSARAGSLPPGSSPAVGLRPDPAPRARRDELAPAEPGEDAGPGRLARPPRRQPLLLQGAGPALLGVALAVAAQLGLPVFVLGLLVVQVLLVLGVLALVDAPASGGAFLVAAGAVVAADAVVVWDDGDIRGLAGVVALAVVATLLHQLSRRTRARVTESMADTLVVTTLAVSTACLLALRQLEGGVQTVQIALVAAGVSLLLARVGDRIAARPMLAVGSTRGWPGLLLGLGSGVAAAVLVAGEGPPITSTQAALLGLVCAATAAAGDLAVDLGAAELRAGRRDARRVAALKPSGLLLPFALLGPIALVAGELVLR